MPSGRSPPAAPIATGKRPPAGYGRCSVRRSRTSPECRRRASWRSARKSSGGWASSRKPPSRVAAERLAGRGKRPGGPGRRDADGTALVEDGVVVFARGATGEDDDAPAVERALHDVADAL